MAIVPFYDGAQDGNGSSRDGFPKSHANSITQAGEHFAVSRNLCPCRNFLGSDMLPNNSSIAPLGIVDTR
jgi:hypothetical protein